VDDLKACDVRGWGRQIRYHELFKPKGTNANFVSVTGRNSIAVRTYERGVEDETLACGTGSTAAAIVAAATKRCAPPVEALTASGEKLRIYFRLDDGGRPADVRLEGSVTTVCRGELYWRGR
jgi:diaminopimelate epimerase